MSAVIKYKSFETELKVRPDDIDMFKHVHNSKYLDYVLAARYDQMDQYYGMSMEVFMQRGFGWVVKAVQINFKRSLTMGDRFIVRTGIDTIDDNVCRIKFALINKSSLKVCSDGWFDFVMIGLTNNKGVKIPVDVIEHYKSFVEVA
jgi:YbgC/YbaW family acyl-CoA thioester hydrolase